ncbi:hypothetical protein AVEN_248514-1 [Araneus ventricosus]|uniref:Tc1-like transposase DDE domain-containing protein n=1 Tax=Araneus ventricosus TaxID=182803 RepID=A0A4Y2DXV1_ARAVE|nr:hypothetical protein AVEN_248514-1 [Araneus ventricosus]
MGKRSKSHRAWVRGQSLIEHGDHQCCTLLRHPHQTEVPHSMQETRGEEVGEVVPTSRLVLFLDDNARPNTARDTEGHICRLGWEILDDPAYSRDLAPSDFHLFPTSKSALSRPHF